VASTASFANDVCGLAAVRETIGVRAGTCGSVGPERTSGSMEDLGHAWVHAYKEGET